MSKLIYLVFSLLIVTLKLFRSSFSSSGMFINKLLLQEHKYSCTLGALTRSAPVTWLPTEQVYKLNINVFKSHKHHRYSQFDRPLWFMAPESIRIPELSNLLTKQIFNCKTRLLVPVIKICSSYSTFSSHHLYVMAESVEFDCMLCLSQFLPDGSNHH